MALKDAAVAAAAAAATAWQKSSVGQLSLEV